MTPSNDHPRSARLARARLHGCCMKKSRPPDGWPAISCCGFTSGSRGKDCPGSLRCLRCLHPQAQGCIDLVLSLPKPPGNHALDLKNHVLKLEVGPCEGTGQTIGQTVEDPTPFVRVRFHDTGLRHLEPSIANDLPVGPLWLHEERAAIKDRDDSPRVEVRTILDWEVRVVVPARLPALSCEG